MSTESKTTNPASKPRTFLDCNAGFTLVVLAAMWIVGGCGAPPAGGGGGNGAPANDNSSGMTNDNDSGAGNDNSTGGGSSKTVDQVLSDLGVPTNDSPRKDTDGDDLPEDFSPLGSSPSVATTDELFLVGMQIIDPVPFGDAAALENRAAFVSLSDDDSGVVGLTINELIEPGTVWESDEHSSQPGPGSGSTGGQSIRSVAAGDIDNDGLDEVMVVYIDFDSPAIADQVRVEVLDDQADETASAAGPVSVEIEPNVRDLAAAAGDFDGDGVTELAVGIATHDSARVIFLKRDDSGSFVKQDDLTKTYVPNTEGSALYFELAAGNIDHDNGAELVVILNEHFFAGGNEETGTATYWIYDDENTGFRELDGAESIIGQDEGTHVALEGDVALGDIDADGVDEIIFAGLTNYENDGCRSYGHLHIALDDADAGENALRSIGAKHIFDTYVESGTGCNQNSHTIRVRKVFVNTFDVDGDGVDEIQANRRVFEDFANAAPWTLAGPEEAPYLLPYDEFLQETQTRGGNLSDSTTQIVTADVTGDGREDIISFVQWRHEISVWGLVGPAVETSEWKQALSIPTQFYNSQNRVFPIITPCNVDKDGIALKYSEGEHRFVFTEPILIAALAAAPCATGIGQNTDACVTAFGQAEGQQAGVDGTVTVSASTFVSAEVDIFGFGASAKSELTASASFSAGRFYTLEETVEYTTGPLEDTVVFTTIPLDQYIYTVVSHPDPAMVGEQIVINLPRSPITLQVEREFYNQSIEEGSFHVGSNVFLHTPGNLDSYPTEGDADALIDTGGLGHLGPLGELVDAAGAALGPLAETLLGNGIKASRTTTVGQGGGQTSTEIRFSEETTYRAGAEVSYQEEYAVSAGGVSVGATIGGSVEAGLSWGSSSASIYRGTVGSIGAENFSENVYSFGLFTYLYNYGNPSQPQFEVINYWVDKQ